MIDVTNKNARRFAVSLGPEAESNNQSVCEIWAPNNEASAALSRGFYQKQKRPQSYCEDN